MFDWFFKFLFSSSVNLFASLLFIPLSSFGWEGEWTESSGKLKVAFHSWMADPSMAVTGVFVLIPGYNGQGEELLDTRWKAFALANRLVLLAPTFHAAGQENNEGKGYYYPEQGSGLVMENALAELTRRTGVSTEQVMFFGFSAGAHFVHRFALWRPQRVKAFVAYSAGWWSEPTEELKSVPALIMCGEADERYAATFEFFKKGQRIGCPWVWRSYKGSAHQLTPAVRDMAEAYLAHYAGNPKASDDKWFGDIQTFKASGAEGRATIADEVRIELPSKVVAEVWEKESE